MSIWCASGVPEKQGGRGKGLRHVGKTNFPSRSRVRSDWTKQDRHDVGFLFIHRMDGDYRRRGVDPSERQQSNDGNKMGKREKPQGEMRVVRTKQGRE